MEVHWTVHIPQAMQRHTGSVKDDAAKSSKPDSDSKILILPEYGDPLWLAAGTRPRPDWTAEERRPRG